jgi:hypothetical protein
MSHWNNFPACSFMTDFEIVVVQNERARLERESLEQEELDAQQDNQIQDHHGIQQQQQVHDINDTPLEVSVSSTVGPGLLPDNPLTPILPAPPAYTLVQVTPPQPQVELSEGDKSTQTCPPPQQMFTTTSITTKISPKPSPLPQL